jgi:predicted ArsR family transcriptional regulator
MPSLSPSQERVLAELGEPRRADDLAGQLGIDASAVRRHLENLVSQGLVTFEDRRQGLGRPKRFYRITPEGRERGPRNYPLLLAMLMRKVSEGEGRKKLLGYLEQIAADLAGSAAKERDAKARLDLLLAKYNQLGFQAEATRDGKDMILVQRNCPFLATASQDPHAMCECLDEGAIRAALPGHAVALEASLAHGDSLCRHRITPAPRPALKGSTPRGTS